MDNATAILIGSIPVGLSFAANGVRVVLEMARTIREDRHPTVNADLKSVNGSTVNGSSGTQTVSYWTKNIGDIIEHKLVMTNDRIDRMLYMQEALGKSLESVGKTLERMATIVDERMPRVRR